MQLSKNFQLSEFASGGVTPQVQVNLILLARQLQALRDYFNAPVKIMLGVSSVNTEHASGKAAIFSISGKSGDQVKATLESLIASGAIFNGTIGLLNNNQVYYSLTPHAQRWDKRGGTTTPAPGTSTTENGVTPALTQIEKTNKALITAAMILGLIVVGTVVFKRKNKA